jgi:hypothetical protein
MKLFVAPILLFLIVMQVSTSEAGYIGLVTYERISFEWDPGTPLHAPFCAADDWVPWDRTPFGGSLDDLYRIAQWSDSLDSDRFFAHHAHSLFAVRPVSDAAGGLFAWEHLSLFSDRHGEGAWGRYRKAAYADLLGGVDGLRYLGWTRFSLRQAATDEAYLHYPTVTLLDWAGEAPMETPSAVPVPATVLLLGSGLIGLEGTRRRFGRKSPRRFAG